MAEKNNREENDPREIERKAETRRIDMSRDQRSLDIVPKGEEALPKENPFKNVLKPNQSEKVSTAASNKVENNDTGK